MASLFQIVYTSTATEPFTKNQLVALLKGSVERNKRAGITGLLLYQNDHFMQVLEGEEAAVMALYTKISRDPRHNHVIPLIHERIEHRFFPNSAMAFRHLDASEGGSLEGYSNFLNVASDGELLKPDLPQCRRLLFLFRDQYARSK